MKLARASGLEVSLLTTKRQEAVESLCEGRGEVLFPAAPANRGHLQAHSPLDRGLAIADHDIMSNQPEESSGSLTLEVSSNPVPLRFSPEGQTYVADTRVPLETVVFHFNRGATPEEILQSFPSLRLVDIYAVLTYYLNERETVDAYISDFRSRYEGVREEVRSQSDVGSVRERLLARRKSSA